MKMIKPKSKQEVVDCIMDAFKWIDQHPAWCEFCNRKLEKQYENRCYSCAPLRLIKDYAELKVIKRNSR